METEVIGASDYLPRILRATRFMAAQRRPIKHKIFHQDNESAIRMERHRMKSCGEKSCHIHICYFFIKDVVRRENVKIQHCKTENMIADFFTKPLQGSLFMKMRDMIMGITIMTPEERVRKDIPI